MDSFLPIEYYSVLYYDILMVVVLAVYLQSRQSVSQYTLELKKNHFLGIILIAFVVIYMGVRPVSGIYFGDMARYAQRFLHYSDGGEIELQSDVFFEYFSKFCSNFMSLTFYFILLAFLYLYPTYRISKKFFDEYWFYSALMIITSLAFWGYGTNGIRNGLATGFFLWGISYDKKSITAAFFLLAILFHGSLMLPVAAYVLTMNYKDTKTYLLIWLLAIPLSLAFGGLFENFFLSLGFGNEDRLQGYLTELEEGTYTSKPGFRWDFLLYSASGVFAGWYFIVKKKFNDAVYTHIVNIYIVVNAFWILVIKANFSNRFAYLSWFLLGLVIIYPYLKMRFFTKQYVIIARILFFNFVFTYIFNVILSKK